VHADCRRVHNKAISQLRSCIMPTRISKGLVMPTPSQAISQEWGTAHVLLGCLFELRHAAVGPAVPVTPDAGRWGPVERLLHIFSSTNFSTKSRSACQCEGGYPTDLRICVGGSTLIFPICCGDVFFLHLATIFFWAFERVTSLWQCDGQALTAFHQHIFASICIAIFFYLVGWIGEGWMH
jgi:hypothetical protein